VAEPDIQLKPLAPAAAIAHFREKGYAVSWHWTDVWQEQHAQSFTVARVLKMDLLQDIRGAVDRALAEGKTVKQFRAELEPLLKRKGWWGKKFVAGPDGQVEKIYEGTPWRLETIFHTNLQMAYSAGRYAQQMENVGVRPLWMYDAVNDERTRESHAAMDGMVFPADDPFWIENYPPNGFRCRCGVIALSHEEAGQLGKRVTHSVDPATGRTRYGDVADPGFAYNPGRAAWGPDLEKYHPILRKYFETEKAPQPKAPVAKPARAAARKARAPKEKPAGLIHEHPVNKFDDLAGLLKAYAGQQPKNFKPGVGFTAIKRTSERSFMSTYSDKGIFQVSNRKFDNLGGFRPSADLVNGLKKIRRGTELTFNEEYALEALWHEILHNKAKPYGWLWPGSYESAVMECLNQFTARHTYPGFVKELGGKAAHQAKIVSDGYGYGQYLKNFRRLLSELGIKEKDVIGDISKIALESENAAAMEAPLRALLVKSQKVAEGAKAWAAEEVNIAVKGIFSNPAEKYSELLEKLRSTLEKAKE